MHTRVWVLMCVHQAYDRYSGFLVLMGTDTMAYTASCVSFAFANLYGCGYSARLPSRTEHGQTARSR